MEGLAWLCESVSLGVSGGGVCEVLVLVSGGGTCQTHGCSWAEGSTVGEDDLTVCV